MYTIASILIAISLFVLLNYALLIVIHRRPRPIRSGRVLRYPKVSILKPFRDVEDEMEKNLDTFYTLDYPDFELVLGVDARHGECLPLLDAIRRKYPLVATKIVPLNLEKVMNPKIDILSRMTEHASGELYWVSDSNTRVEKQTLKNLVREYADNGAKIVFSPIRGMGSHTIGSIIETAYMNFFVSGNVILAWNYFAKPLIIGKSMLIEKETLDRFGGFPRFREYLAEDFVMGDVYDRDGVRVATNYTWVTNVNRFATVAHFCSRISRWAKMRFHLDRLFYILEVMTNPIALSLLFVPLLGERALPLLLASIAGKITLEYVGFFAVNELDRRKIWVILWYPLGVVLKDLLLLGIYFVPFFSSTVNWRGRSIRIGDKSRIHLTDPT